MVKLVLDHVRVELSQLIVHVGCASVVLNIEVAVGEQGKGSSVSGAELELVGEDADDLIVLLIPDQRVDRLSVLPVRHSPELRVRLHSDSLACCKLDSNLKNQFISNSERRFVALDLI